MERAEIVEVDSVSDEAEGIRTIFLKHAMKAKPGQFVMVWLPEADEKPIAISYLEEKKIGITVAAVGRFSNKLYDVKKGDKIGIRGPYGKPYTLEGKKAVMAGGGYGTASLTLLAEDALAKKMSVKFIVGARNASKLVFVDRISKLIGKENVIVTTDDGSAGKKGMVTDALAEILDADKVFACGPDKMMKAVSDLCLSKGVKGEISMERWMKCGFGLCGHCSVDPLGIRVCVEGPAVDFETAAKITELGKYHRVKSSRKEML